MDARAVLALETRLARAQATPARVRAGVDAKAFKLDQLETDLPGFSWRDWARPQGFDLVSGFILDHPDSFRAFAAAFGEVSPGAWKAWLAARYITASSVYGSTELANARLDFGRVLTGQPAPRERWKQVCRW